MKHLTNDRSTGGGGYGQNIGAGASPDGVPALITNEMYNNEIGFFPLPYGQSQPSMSNFDSWGHFSQIVWQSTTSVGCATVDCSARGLANTGSGVSPWFTVCNYKPAGTYSPVDPQMALALLTITNRKLCRRIWRQHCATPGGLNGDCLEGTARPVAPPFCA